MNKSDALRSELFAMSRLGAAVARELGLSRERVSQWKRGKSTIPPRHYQAIEAILQRRGVDGFIAKYGRGAEQALAECKAERAACEQELRKLWARFERE